MKHALSLTFLLLMLLAPAAVADARSEITAALDYFSELWNEGDLEALGGYYDPSFVMITRDGRLTLAERLEDLKALAGSGKDRGELEYRDVQVRALGDEHALAYGLASLTFQDGSSLQARFSAVYRKTPFGWKAILMHQ